MRDARVASDDRTEVIGLLNRALEQGDLPIGDYDHRIVAVGGATYASELLAQLRDLPPEYAWLPPAAVAPPAATGRTGRGALILGLLSLPTSFCIFGGLLGVIAVVLSLRGDRTPGLSANLLGRVFGIVGVVMSIGAAAALVIFMRAGTAP
jgi:Domain of unknown function (DUF1707)